MPERSSLAKERAANVSAHCEANLVSTAAPRIWGLNLPIKLRTEASATARSWTAVPGAQRLEAMASTDRVAPTDPSKPTMIFWGCAAVLLIAAGDADRTIRFGKQDVRGVADK